MRISIMSKRFSLSVVISILILLISVFTVKSVYLTAEPAVDTVQAHTKESKATLEGVIHNTGGKNIIRYGFKWGTSQELDEEKILSGTVDVNKPFSTTITGLEEGITYYYRAFAVNAKGTAYGDIKSFTVPVKYNPPPVVTITSPGKKATANDGAKKEQKTITITVKDDLKKTNQVAVSNPATNKIAAAPNRILSTPSRGSSYTNKSKYPRLSKYNGSFEQFYYRDIGGGAIEIDPQWVAENIVTIKLPGLNQYVQVHKNAKDNFIQAFTYIKNGTAIINGRQVPLLSLIKTMDGTFVPRHVNWNSAKGLSNHSWGIAIDINAANHFRYINPNREPDDPNYILWVKAFKPAGFSWGNSYGDAMHYELVK